jgi:hypothetical protein
MTSWFCINRLGALLIAFLLTIAPPVSTVHAVENARKVSVVSFGLFGDQGVPQSRRRPLTRQRAIGSRQPRVRDKREIGFAGTDDRSRSSPRLSRDMVNPRTVVTSV